MSRAVDVKKWQKFIWTFYRAKGRHDLPWRKTRDPYKVLVSEMMLQQTQVARVIPKYTEFTKKFPTAKKLARASLPTVLRLWQGLGYNRRAKYLWLASKELAKGGEVTEKLPGVGKYTAGAVRTFAHNERNIFIETNIRRVYLLHFFPQHSRVHDKEVEKVILATLPRTKLREWYWALMDYGATLKQGTNPNRRSAHYAKQSKFEGSHRQLRARILREYLSGKRYFAPEAAPALAELVSEGLLPAGKTQPDFSAN